MFNHDVSLLEYITPISNHVSCIILKWHPHGALQYIHRRFHGGPRFFRATWRPTSASSAVHIEPEANEMSFWKNLKTPTFLTWKLPHMTQKCHDASQSLDIYKIQLTPLWHPDYPRPFASQCTNMATLQKQCWCNLSQQWKRKLTFSTTFGCDGTLFVPGMLPNTSISRGR